MDTLKIAKIIFYYILILHKTWSWYYLYQDLVSGILAVNLFFTSFNEVITFGQKVKVFAHNLVYAFYLFTSSLLWFKLFLLGSPYNPFSGSSFWCHNWHTFVTDLTRVFWLTFQYERFIKIVMGVIGEVINNCLDTNYIINDRSLSMYFQLISHCIISLSVFYS